MKRKRIVVMGFMGSMPIAGVIWQHIHYVVGLQRLGCDVYYIEDSARLPYNPQTFEVNKNSITRRRFSIACRSEFGFRDAGDFAPVIFPHSDRRPAAKKNTTALSRSGRHPQHLRHAGTQRRPARFDRILYIESDPGVEQIKIDKRVESTVDYLQRHHASSHLAKTSARKVFQFRRTASNGCRRGSR